MARTAEREFFGAVIEETGLVDDYRARLPSGPGGCRFYVLGFVGPQTMELPDARLINPGVEAVLTVAVTDSDIDIVPNGSGTPLVTLPAGDVCTFWLIDNITQEGEWGFTQTSYAAGTPITIGRLIYEVTIDRDTLDFDLRDHLIALGFDGSTPVSVRCTIAAGVTLGATSTSSYGFDTGGLPTGSTVLLTVGTGAVVTGKGGAGGRGGDVLPGLLSQVGSSGGHGMRVQDDTVLVNLGTIQGGGGGGGGGASLSVPVSSQQAGGGGGGGAGWQNTGATGGRPGTGGGATPGYSGSRDQGGDGGTGYVNGGSGGWPGSAGTAATAAGGAAGDAIQRATAKTLSKIRAGTITGAETTY